MGYLHIDNLYKSQDILLFKTCYALEKIHGTSAHIACKDGTVTFFSGGESHDRFIGLFNLPSLQTAFAERFSQSEKCTVYGEAYGGSQQRMSETYGKDLKFVTFDVQVEGERGKSWLNVPHAEKICRGLGLEFVDYLLIPSEIEQINLQRDRPSVQAVRNGIVEPKVREGVVLRPPIEVTDWRGDRIIAKHKIAKFGERETVPNLDSSKREQLDNAKSIAKEWVTEMRLEHVINAVVSGREKKTVDLTDIPLLIAAMVEDVIREGKDEIVDSKPARKAIGARTVGLLKERLERRLND